MMDRSGWLAAMLASALLAGGCSEEPSGGGGSAAAGAQAGAAGGSGTSGASGSGGAAGSSGSSGASGTAGTAGGSGASGSSGTSGASGASGVGGAAGIGGSAGAAGISGSGGAAGIGGSAGAGGGTAGTSGSGGAAGSGGVAGTGGSGGGGGSGGTSTTCPAGAPPAFPGAEGFGACARGGRGGRVLRVTTLAASGAGSLQWALDQTGPRTIVFAVSGVVEGYPTLTNGEVTIAGQTSPGGVILRGLQIQGNVVCEQENDPGCPVPTRFPEDVVVRFVRLRPQPSGDDGLRLHHARRVIVDHVSIGNATDEAVQLSFSSDVTLQHTLLAETLVQGHDVEYGGILFNYSDPVRGFPNTRHSLHHLGFVRIAGRLPELSRENHRGDERTTAELQITDNLYWDPRHALPIATRSGPWGDGGPVYWRIDFVNNTFWVRNTFPYGMFDLGPIAAGEPQSFHMAGNTMSRWPALADWQLVYCCNDFATTVPDLSMPWGRSTPPYAAPAPHASFPSVTHHPGGSAAVDRTLATVGCFPRDPMDRRLVAHLRDRTFDPAPLDVNPAGDTFALDFSTPPPAPPDTDGDGMPDAWETPRGLDPTRAADGNETTLSVSRLGRPGYTNLEVYLHERAQELMP